MTASASQLPAYIQMRYVENGVFDQMAADSEKAAQRSRQSFDRAFAGLGDTLKRNLSAGSTGTVDLNVSGYRQAAAEAKAYLLSVERLRDAEQRLQQQSGSLTAATRDRIAALDGEVSSARQAFAAAQNQVQIMTALDLAQRENAESTRALALAQRELALEQARSANLASNSQRNVNSLAAPGLDPFNSATQNGATISALTELVNAEERAGQAAQRLAADIERVKIAIDPTRVAQQMLNAELARADAALDAGAINMTEYGIAVNRAADNFAALASRAQQSSAAQGALVNSAGATRTAYIQLGQQMQDVVVQAQFGTNALQIFTQQVPQAAFALSGLNGRLGSVATFFAGPWGAAIFAGTAILGPFVYKLMQADEAMEAANFSSNAMSNAQGILGNVLDITTGKITTQSDALHALARAQLLVAEVESRARAAEARSSIVSSGEKRYRLASSFGGGFGISRERPIEGQVASQFLNDAIDYEGAIQSLERMREAGKITDDTFISLAASYANLGVELENQKIFDDAQKLLDGTGGGYLLKPGKAKKERTSNEAERLAAFGERAAEAVRRINDRFDQQPRLIDQAARATRELDAITADLEARKPPGFRDTIDEAEAARTAIADALIRPARELREESEQHLRIQSLIAQGREDEAAALTAVYQLEERLGDEEALRAKIQDLIVQGRIREATVFEGLLDQYSKMKADVQEIVLIERERSRELERQRLLHEAQLDVINEARSSLTDVLSGRQTDLFGNMKQAIQDLRGARLFDQFFADAFDDLEDQMRGRTPLGRATGELVSEVDTASTAFDTAALAAEDLARRFDGVFAANDNLSIGANGETVDSRAIEVMGRNQTGKPTPVSLAQMSVRDLSDGMAEAMVGPLLAGMTDIFGTRFTLQMKGVLVGAASGYMQGGRVGSVLGGARGLVDAFGGGGLGASSLSFALGQGLSGAGFGSQFDAFADALGIPSSRTGAQIGGALFGPIGGIVGGLGGGLLKSFKSTKRGSAIIGGVGGELGIAGYYGNSQTRKDAAAELAGTIFGDIDRIAEALGADVDASRGRVSIGLRDGNYRVDPQGRGYTKTSKYPDIMDFGEDAEAARRAASLNLIQDGVLVGLREGTERLLKQGDDLEAALQDALDFENVFDSLKAYKDPVGAALDTLDDRFTNLIDLFDRAGASAEELGELEELYALERAETLQEANDRVLGSLRGFLDDLTIGDSGLSLRTRQANAQAAYDPLAERVRAGDRTAYDDFTSAANALLDIEREIYGSQSGYFDRFTEVTGLTRTRIDAESNVASIAENRDSPFDAAGKVRDAVTDQTTQIVSRLDALIANQISGLQATGTGGPNGYNFSSAFPGFNF